MAEFGCARLSALARASTGIRDISIKEFVRLREQLLERAAPGRCNVSLDRVSLTKKTARSLHRDDWGTVERERNGLVLRELTLADASRRGCARGEELIRRRGRQESRDGAPASAPEGGASLAERHRLLPHYQTGDRKIEAGRDLFSMGWTGKSIFNLLDGWVAVYMLLEDGRRQIVQFALPGAILGILPSGRGRTTVGAQAVTDVTVSVIPTPVLTAHTRTEPEICLRLVRSMARDCNLAFDHLTSIGRRSARERVARLLLELFTRHRVQWPGNHIEEMTLPLTQEQIGDATGLTFVHVNRVLGAMRKEGIVQFHYRRLRILNPDRLIEVAGVDTETATGWLER